MLKAHIIASGSKGNATVVETDAGALLIDCGITKKALTAGLQDVGCPLSKISHVLITHEHTDHVKGFGVNMRYFAKTLGAENLPTLVTFQGTYEASRELQDPKVPLHHIFPAPEETIACSSFHVTLLPSSHDAASPANILVEVDEGGAGDSLALITDTGFVTEPVMRCCRNEGILALEANHDPRMLKEGPYPYPVKQRIASKDGHLSNQQATDAARALCGLRTRAIAAMHVSENNNTYDMAFDAVAQGAQESLGSPMVYHAYQHMTTSIL